MPRDFWRKRSTWWTGETGRALRRHPSIVREVGDYLMSAPTANPYGLYYLPVLTVVNDTGRQARQIDVCLDVLHTLAFAYYDPINQFVWVREMCREQLAPLPLKTGDWQIKAANRWYYTCAPNLFLGPWFDRYGELLRLEGQRRDWRPPSSDLFPSEQSTSEGTSAHGASKPQVPTSAPSHPTITSELGISFDQFWQAWPRCRQIGRQEARAEWAKLKPTPELTSQIVAAVLRQQQTPEWLREGGRFIPHPSRYLKNRRWEDLVEVGSQLSDASIAAGTAVAQFLRRKG